MHGCTVCRKFFSLHIIPAISVVPNSYSFSELDLVFARNRAASSLGSHSTFHWGNGAPTECRYQCQRTMGRSGYDMPSCSWLRTEVQIAGETSANHVARFHKFRGRNGLHRGFAKPDIATEPSQVIYLQSAKGTARSSRRFVDVVGRRSDAKIRKLLVDMRRHASAIRCRRSAPSNGSTVGNPSVGPASGVNGNRWA
jgi:hypothetical protein